MYASSKKIMYDRPVIVQQIEMLRQDSIIDNSIPLTVEVYGLRTKHKKVFEWQHERLQIPPALIGNKLAPAEMQWAMDLASDVEYFIKKALKILYPPSGQKSNKKAFETVFSGAKRQFWDQLRDIFEKDLVDKLVNANLTDPNSPGKIRVWWFDTVASVGEQELEHAIGPLNTNAAFLQRQVFARQSYHGNIAFKRMLLMPKTTRSSKKNRVSSAIAKPAKKARASQAEQVKEEKPPRMTKKDRPATRQQGKNVSLDRFMKGE